MKATIYTTDGKENGSIELPTAVFDAPMNNDLVHQVYVSMTSNARQNTAQVKDRADVRGGGKKPWKQKGTGRARHGSIRSPIWVGGGVTHGPTTERNYDKKINKKMKTAALYAVLSQKLRDGEVMFIDSLAMEAPKTAAAKKVLTDLSAVTGFESLATKKKNTALVVNVEMNHNNLKSFANFGNIKTEELRKLNVVDLLTYKYVVFINPSSTVEGLVAKSENKA